MAMTLKEILKGIKALNEKDKHRVYAHLQTTVRSSFQMPNPIIREIKERKHEKGFICPHCQSSRVVRFGKYKVMVAGEEVVRQRYKCKTCKKTFNDLSHTPLHRTRKFNKWLDFVQYMLEGFSLRKLAELIGDVSWVTLFYWRHKLLAALRQIPIQNFTGIMEMDETYILYSEKERRNITGREPRKRGGSCKYRGISLLLYGKV